RLAALQGDAMTAMPMISWVGAESWRQKETKGAEGTPKVWGDYMQRALTWEAMTALSVINAGVDIVVLRHPKTVTQVKTILTGLMKA
ncbi:MAG: acetyl-CoA decarbonylase/synthase complex subunit delta, partial [Dehalococcoidia bacterium]|nr:acetyl-CoA decarbonylase/synthase complex subunit delta [Dehalococcoidia bacterium]